MGLNLRQSQTTQGALLGSDSGAAQAQRLTVETDRGDGHPQPGSHLRRGPPLFQQLPHLPTALSHLVDLPGSVGLQPPRKEAMPAHEPAHGLVRDAHPVGQRALSEALAQ